MATGARPHALEPAGKPRLLVNSRLRRLRLVKLLVFAILVLIALSTVYPIFFMANNALKRRVEYYVNPYGLPQAVYFGNFQVMVENYGILTSFGNSVFVVLSAVSLTVFLAALAAFPIAKLKFRGSTLFFQFFISLLLIPGQVLLIPVYLMFARLGLVGNHLSVILMYTVINLPFAIFLLSSSFRGIPSELIEAAKIDGASLWKVFLRIIVPMGRPGLMTLAVLTFLNMWNELILALMLLPDDAKRMITPAVTTVMGRFVTNQPLLMTGLLITALPTIVILIVFSQYLVKGISLGVGK
jgi:raffinose/stachyose/melibiose transport system permease protein